MAIKKVLVRDENGKPTTWVDENDEIQFDMSWIYDRDPKDIIYKKKRKKKKSTYLYPEAGDDGPDDGGEFEIDDDELPDIIYTDEDVRKSMRQYDIFEKEQAEMQRDKKWYRRLYRFFTGKK